MRFKLGLRAVNSFLKIEKGIGKFFLLKFHLPVVPLSTILHSYAELSLLSQVVICFVPIERYK